MSGANKTELPTPKKLEDAKKEGNFKFSEGLVTYIVLLAGIGMCYFALADLPQRFDRCLQAALVLGNQSDFSAAAHNFWLVLLMEMMPPVALIFGTVILFAIVSNVMQVGFVFQNAKIRKGLTFEQGINPVVNIKNLVSKHALTKIVVSLVKTVVVIWVVYYFVITDATLADRAWSCQRDTICGLAFAAQLTGKLMFIALAACLPVVGVDYLLTHLYYIKDNMMGKDEVEREHKDSEGNPEIKSHRRALANEIVNGPDRIPNASAVVRNPTHIAVVLRYEPTSSPMPYIIEMADGERAQQIFREAERANVPLYTDIPFARGMFAKGAADSHVPMELSASVVPFIYWLKNNYPERVFNAPEFADILTRIGDVKR